MRYSGPLSLFETFLALSDCFYWCQDSGMSDIYRSQFRMPTSLFEKLKFEAGKAGRSINAELVGRIERSLSASSNDIDVRIIFEAIERLSSRNPDIRYSFGVNLDGNGGARPSEVKDGKWTLALESNNSDVP